MKIQILAVVFFIIGGVVHGQSNNESYFQGYTKEVSGKRFAYHSPIPNVTASLLVRGQEDYKPIVWETEVIPGNYSDKFVTFIWVFGMDVSTKQVTFNLSVNDKEWFSFNSSKSSKLGETRFEGEEGSELSLNVTLLDKYEDQMGFAILKLPVSAIDLGKSANLKISAEASDNPAWFMTFKTKVEEQVNIYQNKVVVKDKGKLFHSISIDFIHLGDNEKAEIIINESQTNTVLKAGYNKLEVYLPKVDQSTEFMAEVKVGSKEPIKKYFYLSPVKKWEIYFVQHTHSDIGYTRPQTEILPEHLRYIDNALDFCDQTDNYPDASKFRWTCETSWSVREYLKSRPQSQIDRLLKRIQEGRIEATGMFLNFSEIIDESAVAAQSKTLRTLKDNGIKVTTAMQNDVNGIAWSVVDNFNNTDIKYLTMGLHAHRARRPFGMPTAFWWQSPAGNQLLAYRSEHYQHGNALSLTTGQQDVLLTNLSNYLTDLEEKGYPYDKISLQFSGYITDNSPPSLKVCDIIKAWNEKYEWPKMRNALSKEFMIYLDEQHGDSIKEQKVAWPDWWTDGVGSAMNETKVVRSTQAEIAASTGILSMAKIMGLELPPEIQNEVEEVYDNLLFYDEHTHGAAESVSDPLAKNTIDQWGMKSAYAWEAAKKSSALQEKALAFIEPGLGSSSVPTIAIFNTLNWKRSSSVNLFIQYEVIPAGTDFTITDVEGDEVPIRVYEQRMEGAYYGLWVKDIPPMGFKTLEVNIGKKSKKNKPIEQGFFENEYYKLTIDGHNGIISDIFDKQLHKSLIDSNDTLTLGQVVYEQLHNRHDLERLTQTNRDTIYRPLDLKRSTLTQIKELRKENGPIYQSVFFNGLLPNCADERGVDIEIRLFHHQKKIELLYRLFKLPVYDPEGVYVAFPFKLDLGKLAFEVQGGVVYPGSNQLEGSSSDWNTIQNFASVKSDNAQIVFTTKDTPLVQLGGLNIGRYYYKLRPKTNHLYSWVLNNYWVTNFKASQQGELRWSYSISSSTDNSDLFATKFGWEDRVPILSRIILPKKGIKKTKLVSRSLIDFDIDNLLLVNSRPSLDGKGVILHVREIEGKHAILDIQQLIEQTKAISIEEVNVLEEELAKLEKPFLIEHYDTKFIKLNFQ